MSSPAPAVDVSNVVVATPPPQPSSRIQSIMETGIAFVKQIAPGIVEDLCVGETPIIALATEVVQWSEANMREFTGQEKRRFVIKLLNWLIDNQKDVLNNALGEYEDEARSVVKNILPSVIDALCAASKGKLALNQVKQVTKSCIAWCRSQ
jgi:hypothetical protein